MSDQDLLPLLRKLSASRETYEQGYHKLPGKARKLLKHLDPRANSQRNTQKELSKFDEEEAAGLQQLLKYHQSFPLNHDYPKERHKSKYRGKASSKNHLISRDDLKGYDKRG